MRSSSGPGIVSAWLAVAMKMTSRQVDLDVEVVVAERRVLRRVEDLEQRRATGRRASRRRPCRPRRAGSPGSSSRRRAARAPGGPGGRRCTCGGGRGSRPRRGRRRATCARTRGPWRGRSTRRSRSCRCRAGRSASGSRRPCACRRSMPRSSRSFLTATYSTMRSLTSSRPAWSASSTSRVLDRVELLLGALAPRHRDEPVEVGADHLGLAATARPSAPGAPSSRSACSRTASGMPASSILVR